MKKKIIFASLLTFLILFLVYSIIALLYTSTYDKNNHNCKHMSYEVAKFLNKFYIPADVVYGSYTDNNTTYAHRWVRIFGFIDFDPTIFWFVNKKYKINYIDIGGDGYK